MQSDTATFFRDRLVAIWNDYKTIASASRDRLIASVGANKKLEF